MTFKQYTVALLIVLFFAGSVIVGIKSALTSETTDYTLLPDKEQGFVEYQGSPYSTVYYSAPAQGSTVAVPMRSVNSSILRHSQSSYYAGARAANSTPSTYTSQGFARTSYQAIHSYGSSAGGGNASQGFVTNTNITNAGNVNPTRTYGSAAGAVSATMPALAVKSMQTSIQVLAYTPMQDVSSAFSKPGRRKAAPTSPGEDGQTYTDDESNTWYYDEEEGKWTNVTPEGTTRIKDGKVERWNGTEWVYVSDQADPDSPVGDIPWAVLWLLVAGYVGIVTWRKPKSCDKQ